MKWMNYSLICLFCGLLIVTAGCQKSQSSVVNTKSGVVIHSSDFTGGFKERSATYEQNKNKAFAPKPKTTGNVIHLGDGYEKIELSPLFDDAEKM